MLVTIEAFFRGLLHIFRQEEWMSRLLGLSPAPPAPDIPGLVLIQIDGLGYTQFERALKNKNLPFLARLLKKEGYESRRHYTGLPSNTPSVQGLLFYGSSSCVPAFSFKDCQSGKIFNMFNPECASAVEERIKTAGEPLLKEGSAYGNIFTGGAKEAHFCASSMGWGGLLKAIHPLGVPLTLLLNFHIFVRTLFLMGVECVLAVTDSLRGTALGHPFMREMGFIPLRVAICVLLREIITAGARIDIARGLPVIHLNLAGYDEQAHHRGPSSGFAHWSLRGIDSAIARVWNSAQASLRREYVIFVYSDHGQEDTVGYETENGRTINEAVNDIFKKQVRSSQWRLEFARGLPYGRAHTLKGHLRLEGSAPAQAGSDAGPLAVVTAMGNVGLIYPPQPLSPEEKEMFAGELIRSAKIPFVMTKGEPGRAIAWNSRGTYQMPDEADQVIEKDHPFFEEVSKDLVALCHHPDAGELLIFGWRKGQASLTFHTELGSHAGPGPEETSGFALMPTGSLPRYLGRKIRTQDIRDAAFRAQERKIAADIPAPGTFPGLGPRRLRVMTYNVHGCMGRDGKISPNRIARIIARHDPDIIALQELKSNEQAHQAQIIAQKLSMTFYFHPALSIKKGLRGNAILSKFPMRRVRDGLLPALTGRPYLEPRGALWVEIDVHGEKIQVFNAHLSLSPRERVLQVRALLGPDWLGDPACHEAVILCGDFNALARSGILKDISRRLNKTHLSIESRPSLKTLPSFYPLGLVDHIFTGLRFTWIDTQVPSTELEKMSSDHLPLVVDMEMT